MPWACVARWARAQKAHPLRQSPGAVQGDLRYSVEAGAMPEDATAPVPPQRLAARRRRRGAPSARRFAAGSPPSFVAIFGVLALRVHDGDDPALASVKKATTGSTTSTLERRPRARRPIHTTRRPALEMTRPRLTTLARGTMARPPGTPTRATPPARSPLPPARARARHEPARPDFPVMGAHGRLVLADRVAGPEPRRAWSTPPPTRKRCWPNWSARWTRFDPASDLNALTGDPRQSCPPTSTCAP